MHPTTDKANSPRSRSDDSPSDHALLFGLGHGNSSAVSTFVRRYQGRVYGLALGIVEDPILAEEIAQEALIRAWRRASSYDPACGSVSTWVLTITRNLAVDTLRQKGTQPADPRAALFLDQPAHGSMAEEAATLTDETDPVRTVLSFLSVEQRRALVLAAFYGYTAQEIGQAEAIPSGTAKARIRRGLMTIGSLLQDEKGADSRSTHPTTAAFISERKQPAKGSSR